MGITRLFRREIPPEQRDFESFAESKPWLGLDDAREQYLALVAQAVKAKKPIHWNGEDLLIQRVSLYAPPEQILDAVRILDDEQYVAKGNLRISLEQFERDARIKTLGLASAGVALATIGLAGLALTYVPSFNKKPAARQNLTQSSPVRQKPITEQSIFQKEPIWTTNQPNYFLTANEPEPVQTNSPTATIPKEILPPLRQSTIPESATQTVRQSYTPSEPKEILPPLIKHEMSATNSHYEAKPTPVKQKQPLKKQDKPKAKPQPERQPAQPSKLESALKPIQTIRIRGNPISIYTNTSYSTYTLPFTFGTENKALTEFVRIEKEYLPISTGSLNVKAKIANTNLPAEEMPLRTSKGIPFRMTKLNILGEDYYRVSGKTPTNSSYLIKSQGAKLHSDDKGNISFRESQIFRSRPIKNN